MLVTFIQIVTVFHGPGLKQWFKSCLVLISGSGHATQIDPDAMTQAFRGKDQSDNEEEHETGLVMDTQSEAPTQVQ